MQITTPDGRALQVYLDGPGDGTPLVFHHGTPQSGQAFEPMVRDGAARGIRRVSYSRPGYGASDRHAGRAVADCAGDVVAIADELGLEQFYSVGLSGGGPHALACAALLGDRVIAAATIGGVAPLGAEGLDWLAGMGEDNIVEFGAALAGEDELRAWMEREAPGLARATGPELHEALATLLSEPDTRALTGEFAAWLADTTRTGLEHGYEGWLDDDLAFVRDWGFELGAIEVPVTVWQGREDRFVPYAHGEWLAAHIPRATGHLLEEQGHVSILVDLYGRVLDDLVA